jgi:phage tail-like protein
MTVIGNPRGFHKKFKFVVEIDDVGHAGFQKASELSVEVANVQYFEGGSLIPNKSPGPLTFSDVTLERGATQDRDLLDWFQDVAITSSGLGLTDVNYKRNLDIVQQDRDGLTLRRWSLSRAWPVKFVETSCFCKWWRLSASAFCSALWRRRGRLDKASPSS